MTGSKRAVLSGPDVSLRMKKIRQRDTSAELALRSELHARGLRYRIQVPVLSKPRRVADVAFKGLRVAVLVDGCFWHGCPQHATWPKQNAEFWRAKIHANQQRDRDTDDRLRGEGWAVVRAWAHESPERVAAKVASIVEKRRKKLRA